MMKKILTSILLISALLVTSIGATLAVFSDEGRVLGNSFSTAKVNIDLRGLTTGAVHKPMALTGMIPGAWSGSGRVEIYNESDSTPVRVFFYVDNVAGFACDKVNLYLATGHASNEASETAITLYNGALSGVTGAAHRLEVTGPGKIFNPTLGVNITAVVRQKVQLDNSADNTYQSKTCTWDEVFVAETP